MNRVSSKLTHQSIYVGVCSLGFFLITIRILVESSYFGKFNSFHLLGPGSDYPGAISGSSTFGERFSFGNHFFGDFLEPLLKSISHSPYVNLPVGLLPSTYPPFSHVMLFPFAYFDYGFSLGLYLSTAVAALISAVFLLLPLHSVSFSKHTIIIFGILTTWPLLFCLDRGNSMIFVAVFLLFSIALESRNLINLAGVFLGLAIAIKIHPVILLIVPLIRRNFRLIVVSSLTALFSSLVSFLLFEGGFVANLRGMMTAISFFQMNRTIDRGQNYLNLSLIGLGNSLQNSGIVFINSIGNVIEVFYVFSIVSLAMFCFAGMRRLKLQSDLYVCASCILILITPISYAYNYLYLFIPIILIVSDPVDSRLRKCQALCLGLLMFPKSAFLMSNSPTSESLINPLIMFFLLTVTLFFAERKVETHRKSSQHSDYLNTAGNKIDAEML